MVPPERFVVVAAAAAGDIMLSLVDLGSIDESTSSGAIYSLYQTASLTSDEVRNLAPCIRSHLLLVRPLADGAVSASTAAAVSESVDRRTSRKRPQREEKLQADGGQLDIFAEDPATDLERKSVTAVERSFGSLRGMAQSLRSTMSSTQLL